MRRVVFDIETVGMDFEQLDDLTKKYFLRFAKTEEQVEEAKKGLSFYPLTAQVVAIGMLEVESERGAVFYQGQDGEGYTKKGDISFIPCPEIEMLKKFWHHIKRYEQFVTFNGRGFDCPFLMIRSAVNHVRASRQLVPYRYSTQEHIDLADQLCFYGAMRRQFNLHAWCKAFGLASPKEQGIEGADIQQLFKQGKRRNIAEYCLGDLVATKEVYMLWEGFLNI